jgi:hypothetical protein
MVDYFHEFGSEDEPKVTAGNGPVHRKPDKQLDTNLESLTS